MIDLTQSLNLLQVGCGSGHETIEILKYVGKDTKLTVSDFDNEMLELCKTRVLEYVQKNEIQNEITFIAQNVLKLDFPDNIFDRVIASLVIHIPGFALGAQQAANELFRTLQPGGIAAFTQFGNQYEATV